MIHSNSTNYFTIRLQEQEEKAALLVEEKQAISEHAQQLQASIKVILHNIITLFLM